VADHFHVIQHVNKAVKSVIGCWAKKEKGKQALDGQRHLFLRNQEDLSSEDEQCRATEASAAGLDVWIAAVKRHGPTELRKALSAFRNWRREIPAFFD
jgi:hypothetical protein